MPSLEQRAQGRDAAVVILAAGSGTRSGATGNKVLLELDGVPLLCHSVLAAASLAEVGPIVLTVREEDRAAVADALARHTQVGERVAIVTGGQTRHGSEWAALQWLAPLIDAGDVAVVALHDAARPLAPPALYADILAAARTHGGALPVVRRDDLLVRDPATWPATLALPEELVSVQTPQAFGATELLAAYRAADRAGFAGTDTAACLETFGPADFKIAAVEGPVTNVKITYPADIEALALRPTD